MDPRDLLHGLTPAAIAELTHVSIHTARRWKQRACVSPSARVLLELVREGELGSLAPAWRGFVLRAGALWTPHGFALRPGELNALPYRLAQLAELEHERREPLQRELFR